MGESFPDVKRSGVALTSGDSAGKPGSFLSHGEKMGHFIKKMQVNKGQCISFNLAASLILFLMCLTWNTFHFCF